MLTPRRTHRLPPFLLGGLTALLLLPAQLLAVGQTIDYINGQTDANPYDTSSPNDPTTLSILSGTATQSGGLTGFGSVIKVGGGTLILSGVSDYYGATTIRAGTLEVTTLGAINRPYDMFVGESNGENGTLHLTGGSVISYSGYLGYLSGSTGTVNVSDGSWTISDRFYVGYLGTGMLNISNGKGSVRSGASYVGFQDGSKGTVNVSSGSWTTGLYGLSIGYHGTGELNITGGSVSSGFSLVGDQEFGKGTVNVSSGSWTVSSDLVVGYNSTGVLNISGGSVSNDYDGNLGYIAGSFGTATVSGGSWTTGKDLYVGREGAGVLNLTDSGTVTVGSGIGTLYLANDVGGSGTLNIGTGGTAGTLNAATVTGGAGTAVVNFNHTGDYAFTPALTGSLSVNKLGSGTTTLATANTYTGGTTVNGGTLVLAFDTVSSDIIASASALTLGGGTLQLTGAGDQTFNGLTTAAGTSSSILLDQSETLTLGALTAAGSGSALNFNTAAGGANADTSTVGTSKVVLTGQTAGSAINAGFTVTDSTGFGLATVDGSNQVIRLASSLLPASGANGAVHYRIDNHLGGPAGDIEPGSSSLVVNTSESARSITVDTSTTSGVLTLNSGIRLSSDTWNFGGNGTNTYQITGSTDGAGISAATAGGTLSINNFNTGAVTLAAPILDNSGSSVLVKGTGTLILTGASTYAGSTTVNGGVLEVAKGGSITHKGDMTVGSTREATLNITGGSVSNNYSVLGSDAGSSGTANVSGGSWTNFGELYVGGEGTGVLNISGGSVENRTGYLGVNSGSSGTANVSSGSWTNSNGLFVGLYSTGVLNLTGSGVVHVGGVGGAGTVFLARFTGSLGTLNLGDGKTAGTLNAATVNGGDGTAVVNFNHTGNYTFAPTLTGSLTVNKLGSGRTILTGANNYTGGTTIRAGILEVATGGSIAHSKQDLVIGAASKDNGTLSITGGSVTNSSGILGRDAGSRGTANVSAGTWNNANLTVGADGTGVLNLTDSGTVYVGNGSLYLATNAGSSGTLNLGTGGAMGQLNVFHIVGGDGTAVVNFNHNGSLNFNPSLDGNLEVNQIGSGRTMLESASTYTGATNVLGGTLDLDFFTISSNILPTTTDLTLGSATLGVSFEGSQTISSLSTRDSGAGRIILAGGDPGDPQTLDLGILASVGRMSALNFNTAAGGADGDSVGDGVILLAVKTAGSVISSSFTVTDAGGFGLATVNGLGQVIRLTNTDLLPASDADTGTDYRIDNNNGDNTTAGSSSLLVTDLQTARSITVDTTQAFGTLYLGSGAVLSSDVWNFGGTSGNAYEITGGDSGAGITTATAGGMLQINNYSSGPLSISAPILDNKGSGLQIAGPGVTFLNGKNTYTGNTLVTSGALVVGEQGSINSKGTTTVGSQTGDHAELDIYGSVSGSSSVLGAAAGSSGTVTVSQGGTWSVFKNLDIGRSGTGVLNINDSTVQSSDGSIGVNAGSSGTVTVSNGGQWDVNGSLSIGKNGTGVLNINDSTVQSSVSSIGINAGSSGTVTVSNGGQWDVNGSLSIGKNGTAVLNLSNGGGVSVLNGGVILGAQGTLNIGTGEAAGSLGAGAVTGFRGAVVNFNYNAFKNGFRSPPPPVLIGDLAVNKLGSGFLRFFEQNTYTGVTTVNGGTLELTFHDKLTSDSISSVSALSLGGGTLGLKNLSGTGSSQTLNGLTTAAGTGSEIILSPNMTLDLGALTSAGKDSALNFDVYDGGADGDTVGTSIVLLSGQTAGSVINPGFTVTDATGFGLATVNEFDQIIRLTNTDLLPDSGALAGTDYLIDNNDGDPLEPGSSILEITASQTARSITVDSSSSTGTLTLAPSSVLSSDVWNFGGAYDYEITGGGSGAGIRSATAGGMLQLNNFNYDGVVTLSAPILDNGGSGLRVASPDGYTVLEGADTYKGETLINNGTLFINGDHTAATGEIIVQSSAELAGTGLIGGNIHVLNGGMLTPGSFKEAGTLTGTTATFDTNSIFHVFGDGDTLGTLHLTGAVTIAAGALIYVDGDDLTKSKYTLMTATSGLDGSTPFTVGNLFGKPLPGGGVLPGYHLAYTGTTLDLVANITVPAVAYWTGKVDSNWSSLRAGSTNWATAADGLTDTAALPDAPTDVTFSATGVGFQATNLDIDIVVNSLTVESDTSISTSGKQTLEVSTTTKIDALLAINSGVTFIGDGAFTVGTEGTLAGSGAVEMAAGQSIFVHGAISVGDPNALSGAEVLSLTTSAGGAIIMDAGSAIHVDLFTGAGFGDSTGVVTAADQLNLHGTLDATAGGTLVLGNPNHMTSYTGGDQWKVVELNGGAGTITGHLALNDSSLGLATGFVGTFDQTTGIYTIADHRAEMTAQSTGLPMANAQGQSIISGSQTANNDVNNHLSNLHNGGGEEESDGSIASAIDDGVVVGQGDGPESPIAKRIKRTRQWEVFTTVNYGNVKLNPISSQSGVQVDSWATSVGIERHLSRGFMLGFAATFLQSHQSYTGGLGSLDLEGPSVSAYLSYVRKGFWGSFLYAFGDYDLGSTRNPGLGLPTASGSTRSYTNTVQYNTGWNFRFQNNTFVTGPFAGIDYLHGTVDAYSETGGGLGALRYNKQSFESLVTRVGWSASKNIATNWAAITPQVRLSYERQNLKNNGTSVSLINAPFSASGGNQSPGQDYMVIGTGVNFLFTPDFSMMLGYQTQIFRNNMEAHFGSVRFGYKF